MGGTCWAQGLQERGQDAVDRVREPLGGRWPPSRLAGLGGWERSRESADTDTESRLPWTPCQPFHFLGAKGLLLLLLFINVRIW